MLALGRTIGQSIYIEPIGVKIVVLGVMGGKVRLGIEAPNSQQILREELLTRGERLRMEAEMEEQQRRRHDERY